MSGAMGSPSGVIVEFVGLPASGKTHVANAVKNRLTSLTVGSESLDSVFVRTASERRDNGPGPVVAAHLALTRMLRDPLTGLRSFAPIKQSGQPTRTSQLRYWGYLLYVVEEIYRSHCNDEIYLVDQGFFQHLWRIHLTGEGETMRCLHEIADAYLGSITPDIVVFVSVDHATRMDRAIDRGTAVDPALFDPNHPLITDDCEAYEDVRTFVPMVLNRLDIHARIIDIENTEDQLTENVDAIVDAISRECDGLAGRSLPSRENQSGSTAGR